jgi:hypothetical protein
LSKVGKHGRKESTEWISGRSITQGRERQTERERAHTHSHPCPPPEINQTLATSPTNLYCAPKLKPIPGLGKIGDLVL